MFKAAVSTHWVQVDSKNMVHVMDHFTGVDKGQDVTGTPGQYVVPDPNAVIWIVFVSQATLDALEVCPDCVVMWSQEIVPNA